MAHLEEEREGLERQCTELKLKSEQLERRAAELRQAEEKKNQEKIKALEKTNMQLKVTIAYYVPGTHLAYYLSISSAVFRD